MGAEKQLLLIRVQDGVQFGNRDGRNPANGSEPASRLSRAHQTLGPDLKEQTPVKFPRNLSSVSFLPKHRPCSFLLLAAPLPSR